MVQTAEMWHPFDLSIGENKEDGGTG